MYLIQGKYIPQADRLESVLATVVAVNAGAHTDLDIANQVPGIVGDDRQGRYYRHSALLLGLIANHQNDSQITPKGIEFLRNPVLSNPLLVESVLQLRIYQRLLPFLEVNPRGVTRQDIINFLNTISDISLSTIERRFSTIVSWPQSIGFLEFREGLYYLVNNLTMDIPVFNIAAVDQPILPRTGDLREYEQVELRIRQAGDIVPYYRNQARLERAFKGHEKLVHLVAGRIRKSGGVPKSSKLIDLATHLGEDYIFEMKSNDGENDRSQVRKAVSQLYEYQYLYNKPRAILVLVIQNELGEEAKWMKDYLEGDRQICLIWNGNNELHADDGSRAKLPFLW